MTLQANPLSHNCCARCSAPATKVCQGCKDVPSYEDNTKVKVYYCGVDCRAAHWSVHRKMCKASQRRLVLYRAGATAQLAFFAFREVIFDKRFASVDTKGKAMIMREGSYGKGEILVLFPHHLVPSQQDKEAILTYLACTDSVAFMYRMLVKMVPGKH